MKVSMFARSVFKLAGVVAVAACTGCAVLPSGSPLRGEPAMLPLAPAQDAGVVPAPLPLRVPLRGVMTGIVDFSAFEVFAAATSAEDLSPDEWLRTALSTINLIAAASLITLPGSGPNDADWVGQPDFRALAKAMQGASIDAGSAIVRKDRPALLAAANRVAASCQSCHALCRLDSPASVSKFAALK